MSGEIQKTISLKDTSGNVKSPLSLLEELWSVTGVLYCGLEIRRRKRDKPPITWVAYTWDGLHPKVTMLGPSPMEVVCDLVKHFGISVTE